MTEVNSKINPIMMKIYSEGGAEGGMPSAVPSGEGVSMPSVDEVD